MWHKGLKREFKFDPTSRDGMGHFRLYEPESLHTFTKKETSDKGIHEVKAYKLHSPIVQRLEFNIHKWPEEKAKAWWDTHEYLYHYAGEPND